MRALLFAVATITVATFAPACAQTTTTEWPNAAGLQPWSLHDNGIRTMPLAGGRSTTDLTTFRVAYPANLPYHQQPHFHLGTEHVIVLEGTVYLGFGACVRASEAVAYGPGSFVEVPAGVTHYEWFEGAVVIQVTAVGPMREVIVPSDCAETSTPAPAPR